MPSRTTHQQEQGEQQRKSIHVTSRSEPILAASICQAIFPSVQCSVTYCDLWRSVRRNCKVIQHATGLKSQFDAGPFNRIGRLGKLYQLFGEQFPQTAE